jgi:hypothetical protein
MIGSDRSPPASAPRASAAPSWSLAARLVVRAGRRTICAGEPGSLVGMGCVMPRDRQALSDQRARHDGVTPRAVGPDEVVW